MRYEKQILEAYDRLGFKPRDRQVEYIDQICIEFLDNKVKNISLSAPTGTGKSIIAAVAAEVVHSIKYPASFAHASFMLTATNVLAHQYHDTFVPDDSAPWDGKFHIIKGASNYECGALSTTIAPISAEACTIALFRKQGIPDMLDRYCEPCEYRISRALKDKSRHLITNYAYYFIDRMYAAQPMQKRTICVFDEAHLLNDLFVEHNSIYFSEKRLLGFAEEIGEHLSLGHSDVFKTLKHIREHLVLGKIDDTNYRTYLNALYDVYKTVSNVAKSKAESDSRNHNKYMKLMKISKKYYSLGCKIDDLNIFEYPHVFDYKKKDIKRGQNEHEASVKPIFVSDMFGVLDNAEHNILMSATISASYVKRTMTLPESTAHIRLPPQFPPENKQAIFFKPLGLNYNSMKDPETIKKLCTSVYQIVNHHTKLGERGIVLSPSFTIVQSVAETLRNMNISKLRIFEQQRGQKLAELLDEFKKHTGDPAVILTPSGFEGIDLAEDVCRYIILVKTPFGSLSDRRMVHILNHYSDIYSLTALMKLVQGAGRAVRSKEDWATTYILDTAAQRLMTSPANEWKDEFQFKFSSIL